MEVKKIEKYVSFRIEKTTYKGAVNQVSHDYRLHIPKYVDASRTEDNYELYSSEEINSFSSWKQLHQDQKNRVKELTGRTAQSNAQYFSKGIMTFSSSMSEDYKSNTALFDECAANYLDRLQKDLGLQVLYAQMHLDESVPHCHILFDNISKETGKGIQRTIKPKDLVRAQDIMGECFEPMNYKRGEPKSETNAKHLKVAELHKLGELKDALGDDVKELDRIIELYQERNPAILKLLNILSANKKINFKSEKAQSLIKIVIGGINTGAMGLKPKLK